MSWKQILGHDRIVRQFAQSWRAGRLGHAYLFTGPAGVGKHAFAAMLANTLLCEAKKDQFEPCGECGGCKLFQNATHPDYAYVAKPADKNEFPTELIKEVIDQLGAKPMRGGHKLVVLDDAETLNDASANRFLKTLEEPPPHTILILLSKAESDQLLPTIRSRCQLANFSPLSHADVREVLALHGVDDPVVRDRLARLAGGSPGKALELNEPELWVFRERLLDVLRGDRIDSLEFGKKLQQFVEDAGKESGPRRKRVALVLKLFVNLLQDTVRIAHGVAPIVADGELQAVLGRFADRAGIEKINAWTERAIAADDQNERYVQIDLILEAFADFLGR